MMTMKKNKLLKPDKRKVYQATLIFYDFSKKSTIFLSDDDEKWFFSWTCSM